MNITETINSKEVKEIVGVTKKTAHAYSRFSTKQQADGDSKRRQDAKSQAWADKNGYQLEFIHDAGISAYQGKNRSAGQFGVFLAALEANQLGPEPVLLVENLDRMSREDIKTAQQNFWAIVNRGAKIVTLHNETIYSDKMEINEIVAALYEMNAAHDYSVRLSDRVQNAMNKRREAGGIMHNRTSAPSWLSLDKDRTTFTPIKERVDIVLRIFNQFNAGVGVTSIAMQLNSDGVKPWTRRSSGFKVWLPTYVSGLLRNRAVLGEFEGREGFFGAPIVPLELFNQANSEPRSKAMGRGKGIITEENLFCGLIKSGLDGTNMVMRKSGCRIKDGKYVLYSYLVSNATRAGQSAHRANYALIENRFITCIKTVAPEMLARARGGAVSDHAARITETEKYVFECEKQIKKLTQYVIDVDNPSPSLVEQLKLYEVKKANGKSSLQQLRARQIAELAVPAFNSDLSKPEQRRAMRAEISRWCSKIEVFEDKMIIWFSPKNGLGVNLVGNIEAFDVNLDHDDKDPDWHMTNAEAEASGMLDAPCLPPEGA